jgi:hypothetical protein
MKKYFKQHANLSRGAMETGDHSKNGASPKSRTSRGNKNIVIVGFIVLSAWLMQSCAPTSGLNASYTMLPNNNSYSVAELRQDFPIKKFSLGTSLAIGEFKQPNEREKERESLVSVGIIPMYYFSLNRWQPFIGCQFDINPSFKESDTQTDLTKESFDFDGYGIITPHVGLRFFLSNKFAINGNVGYKMISGYGNGLSFSLGFAVQIWGLD